MIGMSPQSYIPSFVAISPLVWFLLYVDGYFMLFYILLLVICCMLQWINYLGWGRELVFLLLFTCSFVVSVSWRFLFLLVLGMGCAFLLWHSLGIPLIILTVPKRKIFERFFIIYWHHGHLGHVVSIMLMDIIFPCT